MSISQEVTSLFAALANFLQSGNPTAGIEVDYSISKLNRALNLTETPRTHVLDSALSLMGFRAPQVYDSVIDCTLRTILTVLRSSIECKVLITDKDQIFRVGGSILREDCARIMQWCAETLQKLEGHKGELSVVLLYAVVKLEAFAPVIQSSIPSVANLEMKFGNNRASALASILALVNEFKDKDGEIPLRLLLWHLHPMLLKQDISKILQEVAERPFLSLSTEIYERMEWRSKLICMVFSPSVFVETRALLHNWLLEAGLTSIMELQTEFVVQMLDIISRPMWWGISMEVGTKLPFSHAYFPHGHHLLRTLAGPVTHTHFQRLLSKLNLPASHTERNVHTISKKSATKMSVVDHKSTWSMTMNFPGWMCFASVVLFHIDNPADTSFFGFIHLSTNPYVVNGVELSCSLGAARYISWLLNPISKSCQDLLFNYLGKASELWIQKYFSSSLNNESQGQSGGKFPNEVDSQTIGLFLKEINDIYTRNFGLKADFPISDAKGSRIQQSYLLRRIPLGILLGYLNHLNAGGCGLLLHYAATGSIQKFRETQNKGLQYRRWKRDMQWDPLMWTEMYTKAEAIAGCRIVFDATDMIENVSPSLFETEEDELKFMCQMKTKTGDYLLKCIKRLLQLELDKDGLQMKRDLLKRVVKWRHQGKDVFTDNKDFDCLCDSLNTQQFP